MKMEKRRTRQGPCFSINLSRICCFALGKVRKLTMRGLQRVRTSSADLIREESGASLVETALILPLLVLGAGDFGRVAYWSITLAQSARAGSQSVARRSASAANTAGIQQAALQPVLPG